MKELPKVYVDDENNEIKKTIKFEIKNDEERKIKRINDIVIKKEIEKAPHPPVLPIPKMPVKAPHPPDLPIPQKLTLKMKLHLLKRKTHEKTEIKGKQLTKTISQINYYLLISILLGIIGLVILSFGIYGKININKQYINLVASFSEENKDDLKIFCQKINYKECSNYNKYINALENVENKNYKNAIKIFNQIINFRKTNDYIKYIEALEYINSYDIENAYNKFVETNNILNTSYYLEYINYINQINNNEDININDVYVVESIIELNYITNYIDAKNMFQEKDYKRVIEILKQAALILKPAKEMLNESKYIYAKNMQYEGYIGTAYRLLNEIKEYKDSKEILENPIYYVINNWYYENNNFYFALSFYESSDTCFNEIKNGNLIGLPYNDESSIYEYKVKNNAIYFKNNSGIYQPIYIVKNFSKDKLTIMVNNQTIELKPR